MKKTIIVLVVGIRVAIKYIYIYVLFANGSTCKKGRLHVKRQRLIKASHSTEIFYLQNGKRNRVKYRARVI